MSFSTACLLYAICEDSVSLHGMHITCMHDGVVSPSLHIFNVFVEF